MQKKPPEIVAAAHPQPAFFSLILRPSSGGKCVHHILHGLDSRTDPALLLVASFFPRGATITATTVTAIIVAVVSVVISIALVRPAAGEAVPKPADGAVALLSLSLTFSSRFAVVALRRAPLSHTRTLLSGPRNPRARWRQGIPSVESPCVRPRG
jgi:hypothetical protein